MAGTTVSIGVLGAGRIGRVHAANIAANPGARLAWVADPLIDTANAVAGRYGARATGDPAEVLADPDLDAVVVCTPTPTHVGYIIEAVRRGIAVLCEKPVDLDLATARSCREAVAGSTVPIMMGFNRRFDPSMREVREAVAAGAIGTLEHLTLISRDPAPASLAYLEQSGGIFKDQSIHDLDMARNFLPDIVEVTAHGSNLFDAGIAGIDDFDTVAITLRSVSGALVTITNARHCAAGHDQRLEAFGSAGLLEVGNDTGSLVRRSTADGTGTAPRSSRSSWNAMRRPTPWSWRHSWASSARARRRHPGSRMASPPWSWRRPRCSPCAGSAP